MNLQSDPIKFQNIVIKSYFVNNNNTKNYFLLTANFLLFAWILLFDTAFLPTIKIL